MVRLRPLTLIFLLVSLPALGGVGIAYVYERKLARLQEEREIYTTLANHAVGMSDRSFTFALRYQETLDLCMARSFSRPTEASVVTITNPKKGGIGGPINVRRPGRLP